MFAEAIAGVTSLRKAVAALEPGRLGGNDAARLVGIYAEAERLAAAGKALAARRVEQTNAWRRSGHRSAANWLAATTGSSVGSAVGTLETARRLEALPTTAEAHRAGALSEVQAREIASAAAARPDAEADLVGAAPEGLGELRRRCQAVRAGAAADEAARHAAIHRRRHLRHWTDAEGAFCMGLRTTADAGAELLARLQPFCAKETAAARAAGRTEPTQAHAADALVTMARSAGAPGGATHRVSAAAAMIHVRVDHEALVRGHVEGDETCEIPGVGPIPVATARALAADAILKVLVTKGVDVLAVAHGGRSATAAQRTALAERDRTCVVPGCEEIEHLEIDHVDGWTVTHTTTLDRLARLCHWHHYLKTHCGWRLDGHAGSWQLLPPDEPAATSSARFDFWLAPSTRAP